jgi:hypothetical protein
VPDPEDRGDTEDPLKFAISIQVCAVADDTAAAAVVSAVPYHVLW